MFLKIKTDQSNYVYLREGGIAYIRYNDKNCVVLTSSGKSINAIYNVGLELLFAYSRFVYYEGTTNEETLVINPAEVELFWEFTDNKEIVVVFKNGHQLIIPTSVDAFEKKLKK